MEAASPVDGRTQVFFAESQDAAALARSDQPVLLNVRLDKTAFREGSLSM